MIDPFKAVADALSATKKPSNTSKRRGKSPLEQEKIRSDIDKNRASTFISIEENSRKNEMQPHNLRGKMLDNQGKDLDNKKLYLSIQGTKDIQRGGQILTDLFAMGAGTAAAGDNTEILMRGAQDNLVTSWYSIYKKALGNDGITYGFNNDKVTLISMADGGGGEAAALAFNTNYRTGIVINNWGDKERAYTHGKYGDIAANGQQFIKDGVNSLNDAQPQGDINDYIWNSGYEMSERDKRNVLAFMEHNQGQTAPLAIYMINQDEDSFPVLASQDGKTISVGIATESGSGSKIATANPARMFERAEEVSQLFGVAQNNDKWKKMEESGIPMSEEQIREMETVKLDTAEKISKISNSYISKRNQLIKAITIARHNSYSITDGPARKIYDDGLDSVLSFLEEQGLYTSKKRLVDDLVGDDNGKGDFHGGKISFGVSGKYNVSDGENKSKIIAEKTDMANLVGEYYDMSIWHTGDGEISPINNGSQFYLDPAHEAEFFNYLQENISTLRNNNADFSKRGGNKALLLAALQEFNDKE